MKSNQIKSFWKNTQWILEKGTWKLTKLMWTSVGRANLFHRIETHLVYRLINWRGNAGWGLVPRRIITWRWRILKINNLCFDAATPLRCWGDGRPLSVARSRLRTTRKMGSGSSFCIRQGFAIQARNITSNFATGTRRGADGISANILPDSPRLSRSEMIGKKRAWIQGVPVPPPLVLGFFGWSRSEEVEDRREGYG